MTKIKLVRTNSNNLNFRQLVKMLDEDLSLRDGDEHAYYAQFNNIDTLKHVVVAWLDENPVACGAVKRYSDDTAEIKRMYVKPEFRGRRIASAVLEELEKWASELNFSSCILETGKKQPEALNLYFGAGYEKVPNYGQYEGIENSVCMKKILNRAFPV